MPSVDVANVPFHEAWNALSKRLSRKVPTERWDQFLGEVHANAFTVAGATKLDILSDFGDSLKNIIESGGTLADFRNDFDQIVKKHGWSYNGSRGWRSRVIFQTNLRISHAAGRWAQIEHAEKRERKRGRLLYLIYDIVNDGRTRPQHAAWNKITLPSTHPFWDSHYPPNGFGCRCGIRMATTRYLKAHGITPSDPPEVLRENRVNTRTGEIYPDQIRGIDTGWNYNVGKSQTLGAAEAYGQRIMKSSPEIRPMLLARGDQFFKILKPSYRDWAKEAYDDEYSRGRRRPIAYLSSIVIDAIENSDNKTTPQSALITIGDSKTRGIRHALRLAKQKRKQAISESDIYSLDGHLRNPNAVLYDNDDEALVYVFRTNDEYAKIVVKQMEVVTASLIQLNDVKRNARYEILEGEL